MKQRIKHLRKILTEQRVDGFLISSSSNIFYLSGFNRFLVDHDGFLLVTQTNAYIVTSPLYTGAVKKFTPDLKILETTPDLWYAQLIKKIVTDENLKVIGFEEKDLRVAEYFDLQEEKIALKSISLRTLRQEKDEKEINAIKKACQLTDETFSYILPFVKEGITELQLAQHMQDFLKRKGADIGFPSIVAFGAHSAVPHHMTSDEKLTKNNFVLFDFGVTYDSYLSDMSRTIFFGTPTEKQITLYETVKKSQELAITYIEDNLGKDIFAKEVDASAQNYIKKVGFIPYPHALGHGVGLEVHEAPILSAFSPEKLTNGMVFTIEPGIYEPSLGGVRIEDVFVMQNNQLIELTSSSKDLIVLA